MAAYFADTAFWIAISSRRDQYHSHAAAWHQSVVRTASRIVTTEAVLWEWLNVCRTPALGQSRRKAIIDFTPTVRIEVILFQPELSDAAVELYRNRADKNWSLTDCLSFVVMERHALTEALTTDRHFEQAGFKANMLDHPGA